MQLSEPTTLVTDYALGGLCALWSVLLLRIARREKQRSIEMWSAGFAGFALASFAGGTYHGFARMLEAATISRLWTVVTLAMGLASFLMLCASVIASTFGTWRRALLALTVIKLILFAIWVAGSERFMLLMLDYGSAQIAILVLAAFEWRRARAPSAPWLFAGVALSALGAGVQQSDLALGAHFNHNDLYHVIQMVGLYLLYRGGSLFRDRS